MLREQSIFLRIFYAQVSADLKISVLSAIYHRKSRVNNSRIAAGTSVNIKKKGRLVHGGLRISPRRCPR